MSTAEPSAIAEAELRLSALRALNPATAARAELRAAGVAEVRINALYPSAFSDLLPNLYELLRAQRAGEGADPGYWGYNGGLAGSIWSHQKYKANGRIMDTAYNRFVATGECDALLDCLRGCMMFGWGNERARATVVLQILWLAYWIITEEPDLLPELAADLTHLLDWALPNLLASAAALNAGAFEEQRA